MNKAFHDILEKIPDTVKKRDSLIESKKGEVFLNDKFAWERTVEGHSFWEYVNTRLHQLSLGIGYKE